MGHDWRSASKFSGGLGLGWAQYHTGNRYLSGEFGGLGSSSQSLITSSGRLKGELTPAVRGLPQLPG